MYCLTHTDLLCQYIVILPIWQVHFLGLFGKFVTKLNLNFIIIVSYLLNTLHFRNSVQIIDIFLTLLRIFIQTNIVLVSDRIRPFSNLTLRLCKKYSIILILMTILHRKGHFTYEETSNPQNRRPPRRTFDQ